MLLTQLSWNDSEHGCKILYTCRTTQRQGSQIVPLAAHVGRVHS